MSSCYPVTQAVMPQKDGESNAIREVESKLVRRGFDLIVVLIGFIRQSASSAWTPWSLIVEFEISWTEAGV